MANIQSNIKRHNQDEKKRFLNHSKNSEMRTAIKKNKVNPTEENLTKIYSLVDKGAKNNRIHRNKANRIKSRNSKLLNQTNN